MAINKTVNKSTKTHGAMRNCIEYVLRVEKTDETLTYMTGPAPIDINYDSVYKSFIDEKKLWNKDSGRMYAHNIISWHKDEKIDPYEALQFGIEFADKWFDGFQTLIAVHKDKDHIHLHFVTNTVSYIDGYKLHTTKKDLETMKEYTNDMCRSRNLSIPEKGKDFYGGDLSNGTVKAWNKDKYRIIKANPKKAFICACMDAFDEVIKISKDKESFLTGMKDRGWSVIWKESKKHITFIDAEGHKVRDSNLSKTFSVDISKESIENRWIAVPEKKLSIKDRLKAKQAVVDANRNNSIDRNNVRRELER